MDQWESYANSIEKQTIAKLQEQVNRLTNEKGSLVNELGQLKDQLNGLNKQVVVVNSEKIPVWLGKTVEDRFAKFMEIYKMTGIVLQDSK